MAIVKFVASGCPMNNILEYIMRKEATNVRLIDGIDCSPGTALEEFRFVKMQFHKEGGRQYYHVIQSFSPDDDLTPEQAHEIGMQFARCFEGYQAVVATHDNTHHLHNHIVFNSVSFKDGRMYHQSRGEMLAIKNYSNRLCRERGLHTTETKSGYDYMPIWKCDLRNAVESALYDSPDRESFSRNMRRQGYGVMWKEGYKYVTFTTPEGVKCRDNKLFDQRFLRGSMEIYFAMGGSDAPLAQRYLDFEGEEPAPEATMTVGNELLFLMAGLFRDRRKKTKEEIEEEERAKNAGAALGLTLAAVIALAEQFKKDWQTDPEKYENDYYYYSRHRGPTLTM